MKAETTQDTDEFEYATSAEGSMAIIRAIGRIQFRERLKHLIPLVAQNLVAAGVDFSKVDYSKLRDVTDDEIDTAYEDLF